MSAGFISILEKAKSFFPKSLSDAPIASQEIVFQHAICPLTEKSGIARIHSIANRQNRIEIIESCFVSFPISGSIFQNGIY